MEMIFKKYQSSEPHTEKTYLIYDPSHNPEPLTAPVRRAIAHRNFSQGCEGVLVGPIMQNQKMTVRVLASDGTEIASDPDTQKVFDAYMKDQGYPVTAPETGHIHEFGTVYYFPA